MAARTRLGRLEAEVHHRDATKEALLGDLLGGRSAAWLVEQGQSFATTLARRLRPSMVEQVRWHREQGHELVIVSASLRTYLEPFAASEGFDHVIAVGMEVGHDDLLTGRLDAPNVRGPQKEARLRAWLGEDRPDFLWAYGNSSGDAELVAMADVGVWVAGPQARA